VITADDWVDHVRPALRKLAKALFAPVEFVDSAPGTVTLAAPNEMHKGRCEQQRAAVEAALAERAGGTVGLTLVVSGGDPSGGGGAPRPADDRPDLPSSSPSAGAAGTPAAGDVAPGAHTGPPTEAEEDIDLDDLVDAPPESVKTPIDRLAEAFPGSELIEESA
jgi:DNA polymerase-3 subunit gamma/tau